MKTLPPFLLLALLTAAPVFGQLVAVGQNTGVVTTFSASVSGQDLTIIVNNMTPGAGGVTGTLTSFGFNTPWEAPLDLSKVSLSYEVLSGTGPSEPWTLFSPFGLNAVVQTVVELGSAQDDNPSENGGNPQNGVAYGEAVAFTFSFLDPYFIPSLDTIAAFFNQTGGDDFVARWQQVSAGEGSDAFAGDWPDGYDIPQGGGIPEPSTFGLIAVIAILALIGNRIPHHRSAE